MKALTPRIFIFIAPFLNAKENEWNTQAAQIYSNASSFQFYYTFELLSELLKNEWDENAYKGMMYHLGVDMLGIKKFREKTSGDPIWESCFQEKLDFQEETLELLYPLVEKKRNGKTLSNKDLEFLSEQKVQIQTYRSPNN